MGLNRDTTARDMGYQGVVHTIVEPIDYTQENVVVDVLSSKLPAGAMVVGGGIQVTTAFNDSGTDTIDVGFRDGSTTDDPDAYATLVSVVAVGFYELDALGAAANIVQSKDTILTWRYNGENNNASAGAGFLIVNYVLPVS